MVKLISIDANIAAGKTTILEYIKEKCPNIKIVLEPVEEWENIKDENGISFFKKYYDDPIKYAVYFQLTTLITRYEKLNEIISELKENEIVLIERSIYSDREIFAKTLNESGEIEPIMLTIYNRFFNQFKNIFSLDKTIYIRTDPKICYERRHIRERKGEENIKLSFLENLHSKHECFLENFMLNYPNIIIDGNIEINTEEYKNNMNTIIEFINS